MNQSRTEKFWDKNAEKYSKSPIRDQETYEKKLELTRKYFSPESEVLEFGCGTGSTALLHAPYVKNILAIDLSSNMIDIARGKAQKEGVENVTFRKASIEEFNPDSHQFDAVLGLNILHLLEDMETSVKKIYELTRPGGVFISSTVCLGDASWYWKLIVPLAKMVGLAPQVRVFRRPRLENSLTAAGFQIEKALQPGAMGSAFIIARKPA